MGAHTQKRSVAKGVRHKDGTLGVVCRFDDETFAVIRQRAIDERTSFGEQIRILIEWGLEAAETGQP